jgi:signal transduction histidine kinase
VGLAFLALVTLACVLMSRELGSGIVDLAGRIRAMTVGPGQASEVPITSLDELGDLERAFNRLTARYRLEQARCAEAQVVLDQVDRYKSDFLATVSHELRTPLNSILGFSQVLIAGIDGELTAGQLEDVKIIEKSGNHLLGLISEILDLSAMESGRIDLHRAPTSVAEVAAEVVRTSEGLLHGKPVVLRCEIGQSCPPADVDPMRLRQVLQNLISNAIKFTERGEVVVSALVQPPGNVLEVRVRDTGTGIPSGELRTIFEEYRQLGETNKRRRGTGLGLAICKRLIELHGGAIEVTSSVGAGSTFVFTLPVATEKA